MLKAKEIVDRFKADRKSFGAWPSFQSTILRGVAAIGDHRLLRCMLIERVAPEVLRVDPKFDCRFLSARELAVYCTKPEYELDEPFLREAADKGDECFGIFEGEVLASYGWYSTRPTAITERLRLCFNAEYVYMYKGFTHPHYRGMRLHSVGMGMALNDYVRRGQKGIVSYVEAQNLSSLKSCYRMGYRDFGQIAYARLLGRYLTFATKSSTSYGFRVEELRPATPAAVGMREVPRAARG